MKRIALGIALACFLFGCSTPVTRYTAMRQPDGGVLLEVTTQTRHGDPLKQTVELVGPGIYGTKSGEKVILYAWEFIRTKNVRWDRLGYAWLDANRQKLHLELSYYVTDPSKPRKVVTRSELNGEYRITDQAEKSAAPLPPAPAGPSDGAR